MKTTWDDGFDEKVVVGYDINLRDTQAKSKSLMRKVAVVTLTVNSIFACTETVVTTHDAGFSSRAVVSVQRVERVSAIAGQRSLREPKSEVAADGVAGMSSAKMAKTFFALFEPTNEPDLDDEYTFS